MNVSFYAVHKNFEVLIEALPHIIKRGGKLKLVTTLSREKTGDKREYNLLMQRVKDLGLEETVIQTGYVPYEHLSKIYQAADLFAFPSFTESFGQPIVEAMAVTQVTIKGIDKQLVGQVAAELRRVRLPEPYKGKGIRYLGEYVRRKAGKAAAT